MNGTVNASVGGSQYGSCVERWLGVTRSGDPPVSCGGKRFRADYFFRKEFPVAEVSYVAPNRSPNAFSSGTQRVIPASVIVCMSHVLR